MSAAAPPPAAPRAVPVSGAGAGLRAGFLVPWHAFWSFRRNGGPQAAAVIAYYVLFSTIPALALLIATFGVMLDSPELRASVVHQTLELLPFGTADNRTLIVGTLEAVRAASPGLSITGFVGLAWATLGMFGAIRWALNHTFRVDSRPGFLRGYVADLIAAFTLWLLLTLSLALTAALEWLRARAAAEAAWASRPLDWTWSLLPVALPWVLTFGAFLLLYRFVPNVRLGWRQVTPAALTGAVLFEVAKHAFAWYVHTFTRYQSLYGALGGVMLFMLWVYVSAAILLYGAEIACAQRRARSRGHAPA